ncbi:single-pass membrane and coiled-coil domain-containing protein 1 [Python bivittatus]|uniref:Single-pass membrane and coiled-coil domain-containing protein 1 n=1 Tax=Python bivittatus TaxID=176946 RepID=A0A9F2QZE0_PYTBI|nr:single-pass membrane and coiled-coil domain-containing protein 1 [Python bivittatus]
MAKEPLSLCVLNKTLNRIENKLQTIKLQYTVLDSSIQKLSEKFDFWNTVLEQDVMWTSLLEDRFNSVEINLFHSYICETIHCLHSQVIKRVPDLARALPTLSSVLKRKGKNQRIQLAWESALEILGLQEEDFKALSAFFITYSQDANYYPDKQRQNYTQDIQSVINKVVKNQVLHQSLLCAVNVVENKKV